MVTATLEAAPLPAAPPLAPESVIEPLVSGPVLRWVRRMAVTVAMALVLATGGAMVTGGAGPAAANPVCDGAGAVIGVVVGEACEAVTDFAGDKAGDAVDSAVGGTFEKIVNSLLDSYQTVLTWALSWWIQLPTPELDNTNTLMQDIHEHMVQIQVIGLTFSLMFFGFRMIIDRKRSLADDAEDGFKILIRAGLAVSVIPLMITVGGQASDAFSTWLVSDAINAGNNDGDIIKNFLKLNLLTGSAFGTTGLGILGFFGFLGALAQLVFLVVRQAMLMLVVAALPVAASFSGTGPGSQTYQRLIGWSVAFLLFKPVGALVYFIAFKGAGQKDNEQQVVLGMVLMALCAFVLPSLMRLVAPAIGTMGAGASGAAAGAAVIGTAAAAGTMAATMGAGGGAGGGAGTSPIAGRTGGQTGGSMTSSSGSPGPGSGGDGGSNNSPPSSPPSVKPGAQPALSGGDDSGSSSGSGDSAGPLKALTESGGVGAMAGAGVGAAGSAVGNESDVGGPPISMQPRMQSGWGENAMDR